MFIAPSLMERVKERATKFKIDDALVVTSESLPQASLVPRPSITANAVKGLVKLLCRMMSGGHLEAWHFR